MNRSRRTILLVQPPIRDFYFTRKRSIPYGLACIASTLQHHGFSVSILDALATTKTRERSTPPSMDYLQPFYGRPDLSPFSLFHGYKHFGLSFEAIGKKAAESGAFLVGISSLFTAYAEEALETARVIKRYLPDAFVVLGGHHPTHLPEAVLREPAVDFVIRGEGERAMAELALSLSAGWPASGVAGLCFRDPSGQIVVNPPAVLENPEDFPRPSLDLVDQTFYGRRDGNSTVVTASRGCPMTCSYCCVAAPVSRYRKRPVDAVFAEVKHAVVHLGARFVDFEDENLTLDRSWCHDLFSRIIRELGDFPLELRAMNGLYAPSLDDDLVGVMHRAGFRALNLSLCTLSPTQLKRFGRRDVRASYERAIESLARRGMESITYILVGAPGQDPLESLEDLVYLAAMNTICGVSVYYPAPGSRDYATLAGKNALPPEYSLMRSSAVPVSDTTDRLQSLTLLRLGRLVNFVKELKRLGISIESKPLETTTCVDPSNRLENGHALAQSFFHDGRIRGVDKDGKIYEHDVDRRLCQRFVERVSGNAGLAIKPAV